VSVVANVAINIDGKQAQSLLKAIQGEVEKLNGSFDQIPKKTGGIFGKLKDAASSVVGQLATVTGAAVTLQQAFNTLVEQSKAEGALKSLGVNADVASAQFMSLSNELKGQASAVELTAAAYDVASAGFMNVSDQAIILEASTKGAVGGMSDLNTVGNAVTSVLNAYGMAAAEAGSLVDGFIQTQNDGKIILAEYASQIGRLAPTANAAGVGIDELNAAIGTITAQGVPVEATFTGLNQALVAILKPTAEAQSLAKELGIEFNEAGLRTKGFGGLLADVAQATGGSTTKLTQLFGSVDALKAVLPLVSGNMEKFNKNLENQKNATGVADKAFKDMGDTLQGALKQVDSAFKNLVVSFKPVTPAIIAPFKVLAGAINLVSNNIKGLAKTAIFLGTFAAVLNASAIATKAWAVATGLLAAAKKAAGVAAAFLQGVMNPASLATTALALGVATAAAVALGGAMGESGVKAAEAKGKQGEVADETAKINAEINKQLAGLDKIPDKIDTVTSKTKELAAAQEGVVTAAKAASDAIAAQVERQGAIGSIVGARIGAEQKLNELQKVGLDQAYAMATTAERRKQIALALFQNEVNAAALQYQSAKAAIFIENEKLKLQQQAAVLKGYEIIAEGQLQILQAKSVEEENKKRQALGEALTAQNNVIRAVAAQGAAQQIVNGYQLAAAGNQYKLAVATAGTALNQKLVSDQIGMSAGQANALTQNMVAARTSTQTMTNISANLSTKMGEASAAIQTGTNAAVQNVQVFGTAAYTSAQSQDAWRESVLKGVGAQQQVSAAVQDTTQKVEAANNIRSTSAAKADAEVVKSNATANKKIAEASGFSVKRLQSNWKSFTTYFATNVTAPMSKAWDALVKALPNAMQSAAKLVQSIWTTLLGQVKGFFNSFLRGLLNNINFAIGAINSVIRAYNSLPTPPFPDVPQLGYLSVPAFAEGGIVSKPTLAMVGEGGEREYIIPESKMAATAANYLSSAGSNAVTAGSGGGSGSGGVPSINITTGPVMQMDGEQYVTLYDLERAMQMTADGVYKSLRTSAGRYAVGTR
jgi:TP901 family phage tail tape measure protein